MERTLAEKNSKINIFDAIFIVINMFYILFNNLNRLTPDYTAVTTILGILALLLLASNKIPFNSILLIKSYLVMVIVIFFSVLFTNNPFENLKPVLRIMLYLAIAFYLSSDKLRSDYTLKIIFIFLCIHLLGTFIQLIFPALYKSFIFPLMGTSQRNVINAIDNNSYIGLTYQVGQNGLYMSLGVIISWIMFLNNSKYKYLFLSLAIIFFCGLLLTGKRAFLIFVCILIFYSMVRGQKLSTTLALAATLGVIIIIMIQLIEHIPELQTPFTKFMELGEEGDIGNGRDLLYKEALERIDQNWLTGIGYNTYRSNLSGRLAGADAHNSYLQITAELGIFGAILFFLPHICALFITQKQLRTLDKNTFITADDRSYYKTLLNISVFGQMLFMLYGLSGNPFNEPAQLVFLIIFQSVGLRAVYDIRSKGVN